MESSAPPDRPHHPDDGEARGPRPLRQGDVVGDFQVVRLLGQGGMGAVYLAVDRVLGRRVALKVLHPTVLTSPDQRAAFLDEARATARATHPHVVTTYAAGLHEGRPYLALELLDGDTLRARWSSPPAPLEALRLGVAVAEGLAALHAAGLVHGDIKPENVVVPTDGRPRIVDFGLARDGLATGAAAGTLRGTPAYMAPELWAPAEPTPASDVWALGVVLVELLTGAHPFPAADLPSQRALVTTLAHPPTVDGVPAAVADPVQACLARDPARRPDAAAVARALRSTLEASATRSGAETGPFRGLLPFEERDAVSLRGRTDEVATAVERLRGEPVLLVVGPSGVGKSSFVHAALVPRLREQGRWTVLSLRPGARPLHALAARLATDLKTTAPPDVLGETLPPTTGGDGAEAGARPPDGQGPDAEAAGPDALATLLAEAPGRFGELVLARMFHRPEAASADRRAPSGSSTDCRPRRASGTPAGANRPRTPNSLAAPRSRPRPGETCGPAHAARSMARVLIVVDQLEELFTQTREPGVQRAFLDALLTAAPDAEVPVRIVFTVREEFVGRFAVSPRATEALRHVLLLRPPGPAALRAILLEPLRERGYTLDDPALGDTIVEALRAEPAALPLLQVVGQRLWERRDQTARLLRRADYDAMGGVGGAIARYADDALAGLDDSGLALARAVLLLLITPEGSRRAAERSALVAELGPEADALVERLIGARVLIVRRADEGRTVVELAHEALIGGWRRLARWVEEGREGAALRDELQRAAAAWEQRGRSRDTLLRGALLADARRLVARGDALPLPLRSFVDASDRHARRRTRAAWTGAAVVVAALSILAIALGRQASVARTERTVAQQHQARAVAESARAVRSEAATLLDGAERAFERGAIQEARARLRAAITLEDTPAARGLWWRLERDPRLWDLPGALYAMGATWTPDGRTLLTLVPGNSIERFEARTGLPLEPLVAGAGGAPSCLAFHPDGGTFVTCDFVAGRLAYRDARTGAERAHVELPLLSLANAHFVADGEEILTVVQGGGLRAWRPASGAVRAFEEGPGAIFVAPAAGGTLALSVDANRGASIWDVPTGRRLSGVPAVAGGYSFAAGSPVSPLVALGANDGTLRLVALPGGDVRWQRADLRGVVRSLSWSRDGSLIASAGLDAEVHVREAATGRLLHRLDAPTSATWGLAFSPTGGVLAAAPYRGPLRTWGLRAQVAPRPPHAVGSLSTVGGVFVLGESLVATPGDGPSLELLDADTGRLERVIRWDGAPPMTLEASPDGARIITGGHESVARVFDVTTGLQVAALAGHRSVVFDVEWSRDGRLLATASFDGAVRLWSAESSALLHTLDGGSSRSGVGFDAAARRVAATGVDGTVLVWDVESGERVASTTLVGAGAWSATFLPDGDHIAIGDGAGRVHIWDVSTGDLRIVDVSASAGVGPVGSIVLLPPTGRAAVQVDSGGTALVDLLTGRVEPGPLQASRSHVDGSSRDGTRWVGQVILEGPQVWDAATQRPRWHTILVDEGAGLVATTQGWQALGGDPTEAPEGWRAALVSSARDAWLAPGGGLLCALTWDGRLEAWDAGAGERLWSVEATGTSPFLRAADTGCALLDWDQGLLELLDRDGARTVVSRQATGVAVAPDRLYVLEASAVVERGPGLATRRWPVDHPAADATPVPGGLAVGTGTGAIVILPEDGGAARVLRGMLADPITGMTAGPYDTVVATSSGGGVGVWHVPSGERLDAFQLRGSGRSFARRGDVIHVVTSHADRARLDLSPLGRERCDVLREVWRAAPATWRGGQAVLEPPPVDHPCAAPTAG